MSCWADCPDYSHGGDGGDVADSHHLLNTRQKGLMNAMGEMGLFKCTIMFNSTFEAFLDCAKRIWGHA